jgi:hypothetical protein
MRDDLVVSVLRILSGEAGDDLCWTVGTHGELDLAVDCSDLFDSATADSESIETYEDVRLLLRCRNDLGGQHTDRIADLYACRRRRKAPQPGWLYYYADSPLAERTFRFPARVRRLFEEAPNYA